MPARPPVTPRAGGGLLRRFDGVNLSIDPAFLGPSFLKRSQNFHPAISYLLTNRRGTTSLFSVVTTGKVVGLIRVYEPVTGDRLLYIILNASPWILVSTNEGAPAAITNGAFATAGLDTGVALHADHLYVGNGVDPMKRIPLTGGAAATAVNLGALGSFIDTSALPTEVADTASQLLTGGYSFCWAVYNTVTKQWVTRGQARIKGTTASAASNLTFTSPATGDYTLQTNELFHLFVSPIGLPIEYGHDHTPGGIGQAAPFIMRVSLADGSPTPLRGVMRTGRMLTEHRGALWFAGPGRRVYSTAVLQPGREQSQFDHAAFFPLNATTEELPTAVTGIGVAAVTTGVTPLAPMVITTLAHTYLFFGNLYDDPGAHMEEVSSDVGCAAFHTMIPTPLGLMFVGLHSVYLVPPGGGAPLDVGWPIEVALRAVPVSQRSKMVADYHKGFYKLWIAGPGEAYNGQGWWLDLRHGLGSVPSWWGPMLGQRPTALTHAAEDPAEEDRGIMALEGNLGSVPIVLTDQAGQYRDNGGAVIVSQLTAGDLDDGRPFERKIATRVRVKAKADLDTTLAVNTVVDQGEDHALDAMTVPGAIGLQWDVGEWDTGEWAFTRFTEAETIMDQERPRGMSLEVRLTHAAAVRIELRDFLVENVESPRGVRDNYGAETEA